MLFTENIRDYLKSGICVGSLILVGYFMSNEDNTLSKDDLGSAIAAYLEKFSGAREEIGAITAGDSVKGRRSEYQEMVDEFHNIVTDFYEWGWGQSFHFAPRFVNETFVESIKRCEYHLANRLHMKRGMKVLDVGCGIGGPMRNLAMFTGSSVTGITISKYQTTIGNRYNTSMELDHICSIVQGDFQEQPFKDSFFDASYTIEATCHSPNRVETFGEIARVLKTGAYFAGYEWTMTDKYDAAKRDHVRLKDGIEEGNGIPTLVHHSEVLQNIKDAGFEMIESYDANCGQNDANQIPWYAALDGQVSLSGFPMARLGRMLAHYFICALEFTGVAAPGSSRVSLMLNQTAVDLCDAGKLGIFTPSFYFLARKR